MDKVLSPVEAKKVHELAKSADIAAEVERDTQKGREAHLQQTPTLVVMHKIEIISGIRRGELLRFCGDFSISC